MTLHGFGMIFSCFLAFFDCAGTPLQGFCKLLAWLRDELCTVSGVTFSRFGDDSFHDVGRVALGHGQFALGHVEFGMALA